MVVLDKVKTNLFIGWRRVILRNIEKKPRSLVNLRETLDCDAGTIASCVKSLEKDFLIFNKDGIYYPGNYESERKPFKPETIKLLKQEKEREAQEVDVRGLKRKLVTFMMRDDLLTRIRKLANKEGTSPDLVLEELQDICMVILEKQND